MNGNRIALRDLVSVNGFASVKEYFFYLSRNRIRSRIGTRFARTRQIEYNIYEKLIAIGETSRREFIIAAHILHRITVFGGNRIDSYFNGARRDRKRSDITGESVVRQPLFSAVDKELVNEDRIFVRIFRCDNIVTLFIDDLPTEYFVIGKRGRNIDLDRSDLFAVHCATILGSHFDR